MAIYKVLQDIEAEDKILGPLTLRQFIFALIAVFFYYMCFIMFSKHVLFLLVFFLPPALFFTFFALPFGRDQPTEVWALAKLRFWFKPRVRIWNQSGAKEMVTVTVPKKVEHVLTKGFSQTEVKSRLKALADTIDSRGWAVKNASATFSPSPITGTSSDRLINIGNIPQNVPSYELSASDDILDEANSPIAKQFETMIDRSSQTHREQLINQLNGIRQSETARQASAPQDNNWFMGQGTPQAPAPAPVIVRPTSNTGSGKTPPAGPPPATSLGQSAFPNLRTIMPLNQTPPAKPPAPTTAQAGSDTNLTAVASQSKTVTAPSDPAILFLAKNNDLNVATLAREAQKNQSSASQSPDEVVVSLH